MFNQANGNTANSAPLLGVSPAGTAGGNASKRSDFITLGTRIVKAPADASVDYGIESAFRTGEVVALDFMAFALHTHVGFSLDALWKPRLALEHNYASGDSDPNDGNVNTLQNLFPTNHKFYGAMDVFARQNMHNVALEVSAKPSD